MADFFFFCPGSLSIKLHAEKARRVNKSLESEYVLLDTD